MTKLHPDARRSLRPEREPGFFMYSAVALVVLAIGYMGFPLCQAWLMPPGSPNTSELRAAISCLPAVTLLIGMAVWLKRWQRRPPTRTTGRIEETDAEQSAWAARVLNQKRR